MSVNVAVKKEVLPRHGRESASCRESGPGRVLVMNGGGGSARAGDGGQPGYGSLSIKEREELGARIVEKAASTKVKPPSRKEIDTWTANLLEANACLDNHSC